MRTILPVLACVPALAAPGPAQVKVDPTLPAYQRAPAVAGSIKSVGSDTMNNLMALWGEGFQRVYPSVKLEIEGKGSSTAPPALIEGTSTFGPMSRAMKGKEQDAFEKAFGYKATQLAVAIDMLAVYVHKDNPIASRGLTMAQLDAIFGKTRKQGHETDVRTWGDLGLSGEWVDRPISVFGRSASSGTYGYFKEHVLLDGDYRDEVKEQPGSSSVVQGVASDRFAIGYSGIGYVTADVRAVPLAPDDDSDPIPATAENAGDYPLSRALWLSVNYQPGGELEPLRREFVRYVFSADGQAVVVKDGYLPLPFARASAELRKVGLSIQPAAKAGAVEAGPSRPRR